MCHVCHESHDGIQVCIINTGPMCVWCLRERTNHRFSAKNHIDQGTQPYVLEFLTQYEDMLIVRASQIL